MSMHGQRWGERGNPPTIGYLRCSPTKHPPKSRRRKKREKEGWMRRKQWELLLVINS
jgi:hypothetical protein